MTQDDEYNFQTAAYCHLCKKPSVTNDKVSSPWHITGEYLGTLHNVRNINYKIPELVPVFFHNLSEYDCHHLMQDFCKYKRKGRATTSERYISVTLGPLVN